MDIKNQIKERYEGDGGGFVTPVAKGELVRFEKRRRTLLEEKEATRCLKNKAIWLNCGDENTKFFQLMREARNCPTQFGS